ncbi:hypothetical protein MTP04_18870 [Lysinibacillus sp. PLM2]|nr:hypothetical protein MTP04_18870 [Lysinibacillus sp. PLM2]
MNDKLLKIRFFIDFEKEERWVNEMSKAGWHLKKFGFGYFKFEKGEPGQYIYRNELLNGINEKNDSKEYIAFLESTGVELVSKDSTWAYFRKRSSEGDFELYTDTSSKLNYINRIYYLFLFLFMLNLAMGTLNVTDIFDGAFNSTRIVGFFNLFAASIIGIPLYRVLKKRRKLKEQLEIFND